jgi:hypothetical protein
MRDCVGQSVTSLLDDDLCVQVISGRDGGSNIDVVMALYRHMKHWGSVQAGQALLEQPCALASRRTHR